MANRTILVTLRANAAQYISEMEKAGVRTRETGDATEKLAAQRSAFTELGTGALAFGTAVAAGVGLAVVKFAEFDQQMSYVQAATHETTENMGLLRDAALEAGARTVFSATEAAQAIEEMSKAGVSTADILAGGLDGALDLAAAGGLGVARAAEIASVSLKTFGLEGRDMTHVSDLLAAGAGKAMGDVEDLSQALAQGGQVAKQTGLSIEETTAGLAAFASQGLLGSDAGTSFKSMLQRLTPQSNEARQAMAELGISAYDANGQFIGLAEFAGNLQTALADLTPEQRNSAMATIFGSDAVRAASVIYTEGEQGIRDWIEAVDDQGYAAETAAMRLDNLAGDVEALGGAFDTALIQSGSAANDTLRFLTQTATGALDTFTQLPMPVQQGALALGAVIAALALAGGAFMVGVPKVAAYREALGNMGTGAQRAGRMVERLGKGLGALAIAGTVVAGLDAADKAINGLNVSAEKLTNTLSTLPVRYSLEEVFGDVSGNFTREWDGAGMALDDFGKTLRAVERSADTRWMGVLGDAFTGELASGVNEARNRLETFGEALNGLPLEDAQRQLRNLRTEYGLDREELGILVNQSGAFKDALTAQLTELGLTANEQTVLSLALGEGANALEAAETATREHEIGLDALAGVAESSGEEIENLADTIRGFASFVYGARDAAREFEASIDAVAESVEANGTSLDISTEAGRANEQALDSLAASALELAASTYERTRSEDDARGAVQRGREELIRALEQFGITGQAAEDYANELGLIPDNVVTAIVLETSAAEQAAQSFINRWNNREFTMRAIMDRSGLDQAMAAESARWGGRGAQSVYSTGPASANGNLFAYANGGFATGIYAAQPRSIHKFAEPETRWEAYVSGKPGMENRNEAIAHQALTRLGRPAIPYEALRAAPAAAPQLVGAYGGRGGSVDRSIHYHGDVNTLDSRSFFREQERELERAERENPMGATA